MVCRKRFEMDMMSEFKGIMFKIKVFNFHKQRYNIFQIQKNSNLMFLIEYLEVKFL